MEGCLQQENRIFAESMIRLHVRSQRLCSELRRNWQILKQTPAVLQESSLEWEKLLTLDTAQSLAVGTFSIECNCFYDLE